MQVFAVRADFGGDRRPPALARQRERLLRAVVPFSRHHVPFSGFRDPLLNRDAQASELLAEVGFRYTRNRSLAWGVMDREQVTRRELEGHQQILEIHRSGDSQFELSLPAAVQGCRTCQ